MTGSRHLCMAGGVALNGLMNHRILNEAGFDDVFIQPEAKDSGCSLGAAQVIAHERYACQRTNFFTHSYWGPAYSDAEIEKALKSFNDVQIERIMDPADVAAQMLKDGLVVAWFQGKMEWGPRALGARSILGNPTRADIWDIMNVKVKWREQFRPFAPSVLEEHAPDYFTIQSPDKYKYMLYVVEVKPEKRKVIPAVTHVDGTSRIQTVSRTDNPLYRRLIERFRELTGVPMILNTSFNVRSEPIVCTPEDAIRCFLSTSIDALIIGHFKVTKK